MAINLGLLIVIAAAVFAFDVPSRLGDLASQTAQRIISPTKPIGTPVPVPALGSRPSLEVTAQAPVYVRSTKPGLRPRTGQQLVAVPVSIENTGDTVWSAQDDLHSEVTDATDVSYSSDPAYSAIDAGRTLPAKLKLRAGGTTRGFVVFEVPRGTSVEKVRVTVGPGIAKTLRWSVP